jgi:hypothetical protein
LIRTIRALAIVLLLGTVAGAQSVSIQLEAGAFKVAGWTPPAAAPSGGWMSVFAVFAGPGDAPMLGTYTVDRGTLLFRPRYPLSSGVKYRAVFHAAGQRAVEQVFDGPARVAAAPTRVEHVYPSAAVLPSNTLRLYIYFSAPMSRGEAARRIHILDRNDKELAGVLLPGEELWDPNNQRLTMTFDPGRIKRGLESNVKMGPPIGEGQRYTLVIDGSWPDARSVPLAATYRKVFTGGPPLRVPPDPKQWQVTAPRPGTSLPVTVNFGRPMNITLLQRMLNVTSGAGPVAGTVAVEQRESLWRFTPKTPWTPGAYKIVVDTGLEDVAGNRIGQPFDIDVFEHVTEHLTTSTIAVPFSVR